MTFPSLSKNLIHKYKTNAPRYTSYPTVPSWKTITQKEQQLWLTSLQNTSKALALYFHIPFCYRRCLFCGCNTVATNKSHSSHAYVQALVKEMNLILSSLVKQDSPINTQHIHFGGGTPSFLQDSEFELIFATLKKYNLLSSVKEISIEVDPSSLREKQLESLIQFGFNRISMGIQDIDPKVQEAIGRNQSEAITRKQILEAKKLGFTSLNLDLIYGLPLQTVDSFEKTLDFIIEQQPDRLAIYNFAYLPNALPHQKRINPNDLPNADEKTAILESAIAKLTNNGYHYIGMDHFAKVTDELAKAQQQQKLSRNFMGYTPFSDFNLLGFGASSISEFESFFTQNIKSYKEYITSLEINNHAVYKGLALSQDDVIRKWVISQLICNFYLSFIHFKQLFKIDFQTYFKEEIEQLRSFQEDELVLIQDDSIQVSKIGSFLIRNICLQFDKYAKEQNTTFSATL